MFITIVGTKYYLGTRSFKVGQSLLLSKEPGNPYDSEAIKVLTKAGATCGYVANSVYSVARGTHSAGYVYNSLKRGQKCRVAFILDEKIIAEIL